MSSNNVPADGWEPHEDDTYIGGLGTIVERRCNELIEIGLRTEGRHRNLSGIVHGGVLMALFDRTVGINCREAMGGKRLATATLTVNFTLQVMVGDFVQVTCTLKKVGRKAVFADAEAHVGARLVATATGICMTVDADETRV